MSCGMCPPLIASQIAAEFVADIVNNCHTNNGNKK